MTKTIKLLKVYKVKIQKIILFTFAAYVTLRIRIVLQNYHIKALFKNTLSSTEDRNHCFRGIVAQDLIN